MLAGKKIWVSEPNKVICIEDKFDLKIEDSFEVIIENNYSHISAGTELACLAGLESWFTIPATPGYTSIGQVLETGNNVQHVKKGDLVYSYGPHASYFKINANDRWHGVCVKLPEGINAEFAAFTHMATIALTSIRKSAIELGDCVLVTGLGTIGNMAAQLAQLQGAKVIATDINPSRIEIAKQCGIQHAINISECNLKDRISAITNGEMVSTIIDATGSSKAIHNSVDALAFNGEIILLGSPRVPFETNLTDFLAHFHYLPSCANLKGALEFTIPTHSNEFNKHSIERNAGIVLDLINENRLNIQPFYSHKIKAKEIANAYDGLKNKPDEYIGVVIDWNKNY